MRFRKIAENENWVMLVNDAGETGYTQAQNVEDVFSGDQPEDQNGTTPTPRRRTSSRCRTLLI